MEADCQTVHFKWVVPRNSEGLHEYLGGLWLRGKIVRLVSATVVLCYQLVRDRAARRAVVSGRSHAQIGRAHV